MKKSKKPAVGIVSGSELLPESELIQYKGGYATPQDKFEPGIVTLVGFPDPAASDCPFDELTHEWWQAHGYDTPPANYTGKWPATSALDKKNALLAANEEHKNGSKKRKPEENTFWRTL